LEEEGKSFFLIIINLLFLGDIYLIDALSRIKIFMNALPVFQK